jgi:N-acetylmuramoyl-L-alanine amidase
VEEVMRAIRKIIVHTTDSPNDRDPKTPGDQDDGAKEIDAWHRKQGWSEIGYHWVVRRSGVVERGRAESKMGAHCKGQNSDSIGVVWVGDTQPTEAQYKSLVGVVVGLCIRNGLSANKVYGHCEFDKGKTCPDLNMPKLRTDIAAKLGS